jgi:hypothetical protein
MLNTRTSSRPPRPLSYRAFSTTHGHFHRTTCVLSSLIRAFLRCHSCACICSQDSLCSQRVSNDTWRCKSFFSSVSQMVAHYKRAKSSKNLFDVALGKLFNGLTSCRLKLSVKLKQQYKSLENECTRLGDLNFQTTVVYPRPHHPIQHSSKAGAPPFSCSVVLHASQACFLEDHSARAATFILRRTGTFIIDTDGLRGTAHASMILPISFPRLKWMKSGTAYNHSVNVPQRSTLRQCQMKR